MTKTAIEAERRVVGSLITVFRNFGFEGASFTRFTESSGLIKASLYHRFPDGKEQMALAALTEVDRIFQTHVLVPLDDPGDPSRRLKRVIKRLDAFYEGGTQGCLLETLSGCGTPPRVQAHVKNTLDFWIGKFAQFAGETGFSPKEAKARAQAAVAAIEGALVVSRAQGSPAEFERTLDSLSTRLLKR